MIHNNKQILDPPLRLRSDPTSGRRPRVLMVNEASFLNTGYSTYGKALLSRLHNSGKYEVAELACYGTQDDPRQYELPWKYFWNQPPKERWGELGYSPNSAHAFGAWRLNDVLLEYQCDVILDIRDHWMMAHENESPFRRFFHLAIMPTVDAMPQAEEWISTYMQADSVHTYTDWGESVLNKQCGGLIHLAGAAPPAADYEIFKPMNRAAVRRTFNFEDDVLIVGTIMRNQPRKLYPQLIKDFAKFISEAPSEIAKRSHLYIHTSYPDKEAWDIPYLIKHSGISHKILLTYRCLNCRTVFASFFQDARCACVKCGAFAAMTPSSSNGVDQKSLASILNLFDVYVQYANSEGFGMPQVEAAACGVPVMSVDYSAMGDVVRKLQGVAINVSHLEVEPMTNCLRASPDSNSFVRDLINFFTLPKSARDRWSDNTQKLALHHYNWDNTARRWMETIDYLMTKPKADWRSPPRKHTPILPDRQFSSNEEFVEFCIRHVLGRPEWTTSYFAMKLIKDLNWGSSTRGTESNKMKSFTGDDMIEELWNMCYYYNEWEDKRCKIILNDSAF